MLYSPGHQFIFVKSSKTAGTSIEIALSSHLHGEDDIITPLGSKDELLRLAHGGSAPRNCFRTEPPGIQSAVRVFRILGTSLKITNTSHNLAGAIESLLSLRHARKNLQLWNHISTDQLIDAIGLDKFSACFSCGFVREPTQRAISQFFWRNRLTDFSACTAAEMRRAFLDFAKNEYRSLQPQLQGVKYRGVGVSRIYKFEELHASYLDICDHLAVAASDRMQSLPVAKANVNPNYKPRIPKDELLTEEAKSIIQGKCRWEYEHHYEIR